ncbi:glycosyltransferase [Streptomyces sp. ID05-04B]|uniref:glycosyltransferase n=1 Tax=unclassified Streptomyces TaxID=2593676 RepID=UPI000D19E2FB|nr:MULTISPECIES: glycosyltransferase [unclassified Streptomyces]AVV45727.1 glycosyl transferase family 2 [Streptomyces sp. P3]MDX5563275.1 glycosyltransferase [Streptomyces sp. ID05-04B]
MVSLLPPSSAKRDAHSHEGIPSCLRRPPVELEIVIPAVNEELRLPRTIAATVDYLREQTWSSAVVVVDNDSVDCTIDVPERFDTAMTRVHVIGCAEHGKGAAVRRGILTSSARFIGFVDADNATPIATLDKALPLLRDGHAAVIASRHIDGAHCEVDSALRRCGGWTFRRLTRLSLPDIADTQCGFKFFDGPLVRNVAAACQVNGFAFDVELLTRLTRLGGSVVEVPVDWSDMPGSTFSAQRDGLRSMADMLRVSLSRGDSR